MADGTTIFGCGCGSHDNSRTSCHYGWIYWLFSWRISRSLYCSTCDILTLLSFHGHSRSLFQKYGKNPAIKAFVDGVTAAAIGAIAGAVCVLGMRQFTDMTSVAFAVITVLILLKFKKIQEPIIILIAAIVGLLIKAAL